MFVVRNCSIRKDFLRIQQQPLLLNPDDIFPYATFMHNQPFSSTKSPNHEWMDIKRKSVGLVRIQMKINLLHCRLKIINLKMKIINYKLYLK